MIWLRRPPLPATAFQKRNAGVAVAIVWAAQPLVPLRRCPRRWILSQGERRQSALVNVQAMFAPGAEAAALRVRIAIQSRGRPPLPIPVQLVPVSRQIWRNEPDGGCD